MIGTLDSGCARAELPVLGRANVLLVSPLNTATELTRGHRGKIARLSAPDDAQAAAAARFLRNRGVATVAVGSDGTKRGDDYRKQFVVAARRLGLRIVSKGNADAAYAAGILSDRSRADVEALRAARSARSARSRGRLRAGGATRGRRRPRRRGRLPLRRPECRSSDSARPGATS